MFFKNAHVYRLPQPWLYDTATLNELLTGHAFVPCGRVRESSFGWISPIAGTIPDAEATFVYEIGGAQLICARKEEKVIPTSALSERLDEALAKIESTEGRSPGRRERLRVKDDIRAELIPQALTRSKHIRAYVSATDRVVVIDTPSTREADALLDCLRATLGTLPVVPPQIKQSPGDVLTRWLVGRDLPGFLSLHDQCDLFDPEDAATVRCRKVNLGSDEIRAHLRGGMRCARLGLKWRGEMTFSIDADLVLRGLAHERIRDEAADHGDDDEPLARLDAEFSLLTLEFRDFLPKLFEALGGENQGAYSDESDAPMAEA